MPKPRLCSADDFIPASSQQNCRLQLMNETSPDSSSARGQGRAFFSTHRHQRGQKRRFGAAGIINVALTNLALQALLASNAISVTAATLISQLINTCLGYAIYGKIVFRAQGLRHHQPLVRYLLLMTAMWILNTVGIELGEAAGINKNFAAAGLVPFLAVLSYFCQKRWVFK